MSADERPNKIRKLSHDAQEHSPDPTTQPKDASFAGLAASEDTAEPHLVTESDPLPPVEKLHQEEDVEDDNASTSTPADASTTSPSQSLSKNQLRKLRKKQQWEAGKAYRKIKRKEKTKEKRERKREQRKANGDAENPEPSEPTRHRRGVRLPVTFLIDCGFDDKMMDKERISLGSQITRAYSDNSKAPYQAHLAVSSWNGKLRERFDTTLDGQYKNWKNVSFTEGDFVHAAEAAQKEMQGPAGGKMDGIFGKYAKGKKRRNTNGILQIADHGNAAVQPTTDPTPASDANDHSEVQHHDSVEQQPTTTTEEVTTQPPSLPPVSPTSDNQPPPPPTPLPPAETIYLTSDSPDTLETLSPYSTYIIGGLVDKNRHKGICYRVACDAGIKTAKLPIGQYMEMQSRFVLATNHVVEIMVRYLECGDWGEAFMKVIPKRKGGKLKGEGAGGEEVSAGKDEEGGRDGDVDMDGDDGSGDDDDGDDGSTDVEHDEEVTIETDVADTTRAELVS